MEEGLPPGSVKHDNIAIVEWETDLGWPPVSYFVEATPEQREEIDKLIHEHLEAWQGAYVGPVITIPFEAFMADFKENWVADEP